jgi:protein ImuB
MHRRIACISLPDIRVEIARERESSSRDSPLAVIVARPAGVVKTERDILGNTRIDFVSREGRAFGVRPGQTMAAARAICAELRVRVVAEGIVRTALARIAETVLAFGPATAFDVTQDVVWVDVGGCAHLHGGEVELARTLGAHVRAMGHACCVAVADGPRVSAAVARHLPTLRERSATDSAGASSDFEPVVVPAGKGALAVRSLPISALGLDDDVSTWLADLGLKMCGDLQKLPRRALGTRLRERVQDVMLFLDGRDPAPLEAWRPPEVPEERFELDWGAHSIETLVFALKTLCDRLAVRLHGRALAAARLEIVFSLDRALCPDPCRHRLELCIVLPSPIARAADLLAVVRARLEGCSLEAPVLAVTLRIPELARASSRTLDLLTPEPKADHALPRLIGELVAEFGEGAVGILALVDTWVPTDRTRLVPSLGMPSVDKTVDRTRKGVAKPRHALTTSALEPSRLVKPSHVSRSALARAHHIARVEAVEWWANRSSSQGCVRRDLFAAWIDGALGWLELRDSNEKPLLCGWID